MEGDLLFRAETLALLVTVLILGGGLLYWGYTAFKTDKNSLKEQSDVLSCSQKKVEMMSHTGNDTHFTAYLESNSDFRLEVYGNGNETVAVKKSSTVQKIVVPVPNVSRVEAVFPECERAVDLI